MLSFRLFKVNLSSHLHEALIAILEQAQAVLRKRRRKTPSRGRIKRDLENPGAFQGTPGCKNFE